MSVIVSKRFLFNYIYVLHKYLTHKQNSQVYSCSVILETFSADSSADPSTHPDGKFHTELLRTCKLVCNPPPEKRASAPFTSSLTCVQLAPHAFHNKADP